MKRKSSGERLPTICFVLTAKNLGLYADMSAVSALAVCRLHPRARTILVTDEPTARAIDHRCHPLGNIVSEIIVQPTGTDDAIVSSRHLRTVLRQLVKGDYLYLDSDAIAVRPLDRGWPEADLALARDWNRRGIPRDALPITEKLRAKLGWEFPAGRYLNAGVMFVRDTPAAHGFYAEWHRRWKQALSLGIREDQWSLNSASATGVATIEILSDRDNWATRSIVMLRGRARVFHFWASAYGGRIPADTLLGHLIVRFQRDGTLDEAAIVCATRDNFPWMNHDVGSKRLIASGLYIRATSLAATRVARRIRRKLFRCNSH